MSRVLTNKTSLQSAEEASLGTLPGTPLWYETEPNDIGTFGAEISTTPRAPISKDRQNRKGAVTDLDSSVEWEGDVTLSHMERYLEAFVFAQFQSSTVIRHLQAGANFDSLAADDDPPATGTDSGYTHSALSAAIPENTLVYARGFTNAINNGLKEVTADSTTTNTTIETDTLIDETPAESTGASLDVAGFRFTDLTWTDATNQIGSAAVDLTTLGLSLGQVIRVGSGTNDFSNGAVYGRITAITAALITLDKVQNEGSGTLDGGGDEAASSVDLLYGRFVKNVDVDDSLFLERSFHFELALPDLGGVGTDEYEYAKGNLANSLALALNGQDKATATFGFIGTDTDKPTTTRKSGAGSPIQLTRTEPLNTSSDILRLRITKSDESGLTTCFKNVTLTVRSEVSPEKCLATLGAVFMNQENFTVTLEGQVLLTTSDLVDAIRDNDTLGLDLIVRNSDGGMALDIPSLTLSGGDKELPVNESVRVNLTGTAFKDATLDTSLGVSLFPFLPAS